MKPGITHLPSARLIVEAHTQVSGDTPDASRRAREVWRIFSARYNPVRRFGVEIHLRRERTAAPELDMIPILTGDTKPIVETYHRVPTKVNPALLHTN